MEDFNSLGLPPQLQKALIAMNFTTPTPIQAQAIPLALEGKDILGSAQTGTGKTGAFGIPLVSRLLSNPRGSALVMTPTRELAQQVLKALTQMLGERSPIKTAMLIGGEPMPKQLQQLRMRPRLIVGTPGRINDHLERGTLMLADTGFLVLDETDRMLDMGFAVQIERVLKFMPATRQTLLFSATLPKEIERMAAKYQKDPHRISVGSTTATAPKIVTESVTLAESEKYARLLEEFKVRTGSIIVFVKTKYGAEKMAIRLQKSGHSTDALHGDLRQSKRDKVIAAFRDSKYRILIATDIAARGLDIPHVEHVINFDLPQAPEDYIHRIGRTARAGAEGAALNFISPADGIKWRAIEAMFNGTKAPTESGPRRSGGGNGGGNRGRNANGNKRSFSDGKPAGKSGHGQGRSDRPRSEKPHSDKPRAEGATDKPRGERTFDKPRTDRPRTDRPQGDAPRGATHAAARPAGKPRFRSHRKPGASAA